MSQTYQSAKDFFHPSIGKSLLRVEDAALLTGQARFTADIELENVLHMSFIRSIYAHARIKSINKQHSENTDGITAVLTGKDISREFPVTVPSIGAISDSYSDVNFPQRHLLAIDEACFVGDPIALVLAETQYLAIDALDAIAVDYDPLPVCIDAEQALLGTNSKTHNSLPNNIAFRWKLDAGNVDHALNAAEIVLKHRLVIHRVIPTALEPRAVLARFDPDSDHLTIWITTQIPHQYQSVLASVLEIPPERVRVIAPNVGGGFGAKSNIYPEDLLAGLLSRKFGRPVRWVASRTEDIQATSHGRDQICDIRLAANQKGRILGIDAKLIADCGAYGSSWAPFISPVTASMITGAYEINNCRVNVVGVFTNKTPTEPYRGAGQPEATYFIERSLDILAQKINIDPADIRRTNFISAGSFPYKSAGGFSYDSGDYLKTLNRALTIIGYSDIRQQQAHKQKSEKILLGVGLSSYVALGGPGPWEYGEVTVSADGQVTVFSGTASQGQGHQTAWTQIVAEVLQIPLNKIKIYCGDTGKFKSGIGTYGSRSASVGGNAISANAIIVKQNGLRVAAKILKAAVDDVILEDGLFTVRGELSLHVTWDQIAAHSNLLAKTGKQEYPLTSRKLYKPSGFTAAFGTHVCVVKIEIETGQTSITKFITVDDCGKVINPAIVEGQIHGGTAQGIGQALLEHASYDEGGNLLTGSLMDYLIPGAQDLPTFENYRTETPSPTNPLGVKGVGEAATIGSTPAVVNAVVDALSVFEINHMDLPLTPEKIWNVINQSR